MQEEPIPEGKVRFECSGATFIVDDRYEFIKALTPKYYGPLAMAFDKVIGKKVSIEKTKNFTSDFYTAKRILRRIRLLHFLDHENIIQIHNIEIFPQSNFIDLYIITENLDTDLYQVLRSSQNLSNEHYQYFMYQALKSLYNLHSADIIHGVIKPEDLLLNENCDLKLSNLDTAQKVGFIEDIEDYVSNRWYRAPELILSRSSYNEKIDIWSLGCIFAEMIGRKPLFPGVNYQDQIKKMVSIIGTPTAKSLEFIENPAGIRFIKELPIQEKKEWRMLFPNATNEAYDLLEKMLVFDPRERATVQECLRSQYFYDLFFEEDLVPTLEKFDWDGENFLLNEENVKKYAFEELKKFVKC